MKHRHSELSSRMATPSASRHRRSSASRPSFVMSIRRTLARGAQRELERDDASAKKKMVPAVSFMTVRDERRALQEIRAMKDPKPNQQLTSCDMSVALFALRFIVGHHVSALNNSEITLHAIVENHDFCT
ncbi:hypothetical protein JKP88DRAFT_250982 [Tribonema minus]|uniref:Uncharacterized protein n=1 Tax=Tribonema minus TaxID=303371 RepID=A0A836CQQ8_9STRA|nr:hypothetical protein JKP88DRAFT_250982 [Tribonema minus]